LARPLSLRSRDFPDRRSGKEASAALIEGTGVPIRCFPAIFFHLALARVPTVYRRGQSGNHHRELGV